MPGKSNLEGISLEEMMSQLGANPVSKQEQPVESPPPAPQPHSFDRSNRMIGYLNQFWNISVLNLSSKRRHFSWVMTLYKKFLSLILRPYMNVILYRQAEFNENVARFSNDVWARLIDLKFDLDQLQKKMEKDVVDHLQKLNLELNKSLSETSLKFQDQLNERLRQVQAANSAASQSAQQKMTQVVHEETERLRADIQGCLDGKVEQSVQSLDQRVNRFGQEIQAIERQVQERFDETMMELTQLVMQSISDEEADFLPDEDAMDLDDDLDLT